MQNQAAVNNMNAANAFSAQQFATRYQTTVKDLEAAGLNPMLAYGATPSPPSSASPAPVQNKLAGVSSSVGDATQKALGAANVAMDTQQKDANVTNTISQTGVNDQQRKLMDAQTNNSIVDALLKAKQGGLIDQQTASEVIRQSLLRAQTNETSARAAYERNQTRITQPSADVSTDEKGKSTPYAIGREYGGDLGKGITNATNAVNAVRGKPAPVINKYPTINNNYPSN
jgi:hypothetical protein